MKKPIYEVLNSIMNEKSLSIADVARMCSLPDSTVRGIITRKQQNVALDVAFKLSDGLDIDLYTLNGESDEALKDIDMCFGKRVSAARKSKGFTQAQLASMVGVAKSTITGYEKGNREPDLNKIKMLSAILDVSAEYLLGIDKKDSAVAILSPSAHRIGRLYDKADDQAQRIVEVTLEPFDDGVVIPYKARNNVYDMEAAISDMDIEPELDLVSLPLYAEAASAGLGNYLEGDQYELIDFERSEVPRGADACIRLSGDSMIPDYQGGDIVFVKFTHEIENGQIGIFILNGDALCKRLCVDYDRRKVSLVSLNSTYAPKVMQENDDLRTVGLVLGVAIREE